MQKNETKQFVGSPDKDAENAIARIRNEDTSVFGEIYNARNHCRSKEKGKFHTLWMEDIKSGTRFLMKDVEQSKKEKRGAHFLTTQ